MLERDDRRVIIHFDYDCFYAAVFEKEDPKLRYLPLAVQQKQIIVTCNYEARRHGLYKLQRVTEARKQCPEVIIVLGEDLNRFRNASKENYNFLRKFAWSGRVERLGFDEVFIDVTDMINYNLELINPNALQSSFFHLSRYDPTVGFEMDCRRMSGHIVPAGSAIPTNPPLPHDLFDWSASGGGDAGLYMRLTLGSHLAQHLRHQLEELQGYTSTVGISTTKLVSKLVGNVNKPKGQTTLLPPYCSNVSYESNITRFLDDHDIGKIPGIGFKSAQRMREHVLGRSAAFGKGLVHGGTKESVLVRDVRLSPSMGTQLLEKLLGGPGAEKGIGAKVWGLLNGVDRAQVSRAREVPQQISIEDSYIRLDTMIAAKRELEMLSRSLLSRLREDLLCDDADDEALSRDKTGDNGARSVPSTRQWLACPRTLRLTTRPRPPLNPDGTRSRTFNRISRSCDMPSLVLELNKSAEELSGKLVQETLIPLFHKLHPEESEWDLSLMNLCATNMSPTAASSKDGAGQDISKMFRRQQHVLKDWKIGESTDATDDPDQGRLYVEPDSANDHKVDLARTKGYQEEVEDCGVGEDNWQSDDEVAGVDNICTTCKLPVPHFAMAAHERFHDLPD